MTLPSPQRPAPEPAYARAEEDRPSRYLWLIGVFLAALLLVTGLKVFFSSLHDELGRRSANERARLFIGEHIVRGIQHMERDVYLMTTLANGAAVDRQADQTLGHIREMQQDLAVLEKGGTVRQVIQLNLEGQDEMVREVQYHPPASGQAYVMEVIELRPLLQGLGGRIQELRSLLKERADARDRSNPAELRELEHHIATFLKHVPPQFVRLEENANRLFFESSQRLQTLERQLDQEGHRYRFMENLLVVLVIILATVAGLTVARQIRESNRRLRLAWEAMRAAKEQAEQASRAKSEFVSRMSHELRTPLNAILGFAQLLEEETRDPEHKDWVGEINRAGVHLLELINQVLDLAKIEAGRLTLEDIPFDLLRIVDEVAALLSDQARSKGLALRFRASPQVPTLVQGDPTRLRQILINLAGNAIKFTDQGSIDLEVRPVDGGEHIEFSIRDSGIGMDAQTLGRLFQPFSQADESITRRFGGTGLGLMIARDLVQAMGGDIQVESEPGRGTRFWFSLPARPAPDAPARPLPLAGWRALVSCVESHQAAVLADHLEAMGARVSGPQAMAEEPEKPWLWVGQAACLTELATREGSRPAGPRLRLLLPGPPLAAVAGMADIALTEPYTYSRLLEQLQEALAKQTVLAQPPRRPRALLVEGNPLHRMATGRLLAKLGVDPETARDGGEALDLVEQGHYDLLFMDIPTDDDAPFLSIRLLRDREVQAGRPRLPVVALLSQASEAARQSCLSQGVDHCLAKPVDVDALTQLLTDLKGN